MKKIIICLVLISVYACSSNKIATATTSVKSKEVTPTSKKVKDGSSIENAIVIKASSESAGVRAEYVLLEKMFPKYRVKSQGTSSRGSKNYDAISIVTADNVEKVIYFDITNFYGKF